MRVGTFAAVGAVAFLVIGNHVAPWEPPASYSRGVAALAMKQLEDAEKWLSRAIEEDPGFWRAYRDLGECLLRGERPREAVEVLERAVDLEPRDERTQALLSDARSELSSLPNDEDDVPPAVAVEAVQTPMPTRPLGDFARRPPPDGPARTYVITGSPGAAEQETVAGDTEPVSGSGLDQMRRHAETIYRPRMARAAADVGSLRNTRRQYRDACLGTTTEVIAGRSRGYGESSGDVYDDRYSRRRPVATFNSTTEWVEDWDAVRVSKNSETPTCLRIASDFEAALQRIEGEMSGVAQELKAPPSVYPGIANEVYAALKAELW